MPRRIPDYRYSRSGATLLHEMLINPINTEIDECYRIFRDSLKQALVLGDAEKANGKYHLCRKNAGIYLPERRWFTLQDITASKKILKKHKHTFLRLADWNDIDTIIHITKRLRVKKPTLMAHLIASAWNHDNVNMDETWNHLDYAIIWLRDGSYLFQNKWTKEYIKNAGRNGLIYTTKKKEAKTWKLETNAWKWLRNHWE